MTSKYKMKPEKLKTENDILKSIRQKNSNRRKQNIAEEEITVISDTTPDEDSNLEIVSDIEVKKNIKQIKDTNKKTDELSEREKNLIKKEKEMLEKEALLKKKKKKMKEKEYEKKIDRLEQLNMIKNESSKLKEEMETKTKNTVAKQVTKQVKKLVPVKINGRYAYREKTVNDLADQVIGY